MSDLAMFGEHARTMVTAMHKPECEGTPELILASKRHRMGYRALFGEDHPKFQPVDPCPGCVTDSERALWTQIADEIDAYLAPDEAEGLFA